MRSSNSPERTSVPILDFLEEPLVADSLVVPLETAGVGDDEEEDDGEDDLLVVLPDDVPAVEMAEEESEAHEQPLVILPDEVDIDDDLVEETEELAAVEEALLEEIEDELHGDGATGLLTLRRLQAAVGFICATLLLLVLVIGWGYYQLPVAKRPFHHLHETLRPSGLLGLPMGIGGTALMLVSLLYILRKQLVSWSWLGVQQGWLSFHIFTGILGAALILFHASFVSYSALGLLAFSALGIVVLSGVVGRYIYACFPHSLEGRELEHETVRRRLTVYRRELIELGVSSSLLEVEPPTARRSPWLIEAFVRVLAGDRESRREFQRLREAAAADSDSPAPTRRAILLMRRLCRERQWLVRYQELRKLMGAWRFFHRWMAVVLLLAVSFHIAIGVNFGDLWIFGGRR